VSHAATDLSWDVSSGRSRQIPAASDQVRTAKQDPPRAAKGPSGIRSLETLAPSLARDKPVSFSMALQHSANAAPDFTSWTEQRTAQPFLAAGAAGGILLLPKDDPPCGAPRRVGFRDQWAPTNSLGSKSVGSAKDVSAAATKNHRQATPCVHPASVTPALPGGQRLWSYGLKKFMGREYMGMMLQHPSWWTGRSLSSSMLKAKLRNG